MNIGLPRIQVEVSMFVSTRDNWGNLELWAPSLGKGEKTKHKSVGFEFQIYQLLTLSPS